MSGFAKRAVGFWISVFFVAAILCGTLHAVQAANAAEMPDCHSQHEGAGPNDRGAPSTCAAQADYGLLPKQTDIQPQPVFFTRLVKADDFAIFLYAVAHHHKATHFQPKQKTYLYNSALTL